MHTPRNSLLSTLHGTLVKRHHVRGLVAQKLLPVSLQLNDCHHQIFLVGQDPRVQEAKMDLNGWWYGSRWHPLPAKDFGDLSWSDTVRSSHCDLKKKVFWSKPARNGPVWDETVSLAAFAERCFFGKGFLNLPRPETKRGKLNRIKTSSYSRTNVTWFRFRWIASVAKAYYAWPGPVQWHGWYLSRKLASFASECVAWPMGDNRDKPPALNSRTHHDHHHVAAIYDTIHFRVDRFVISFVSRQAAVDWREMLIRTSGKIWKGNIRIVHAFVRWAQPIQFACQMCHDYSWFRYCLLHLHPKVGLHAGRYATSCSCDVEEEEQAAVGLIWIR